MIAMNTKKAMWAMLDSHTHNKSNMLILSQPAEALVTSTPTDNKDMRQF